MSIQTKPHQVTSDTRDTVILLPAELQQLAAPLIRALHATEQEARRQQRTVPTPAERQIAVSAFWKLMAQLRSVPDTPANRVRLRQAIHPLFLRAAWSDPSPIRILDVGCGGARYLHDAAVLLDDPSRLQITLVDQDPAALAFAAPRLRATGAHVSTVCRRASQLRAEELPEVGYHVALSAGQFNYLPDACARNVLATMDAACAPGGVVSICNFTPADPSRVVKDWVVDWPLIYRDEAGIAALWPVGPEPSYLISPEGSLRYSTRRI